MVANYSAGKRRLNSYPTEAEALDAAQTGAVWPGTHEAFYIAQQATAAATAVPADAQSGTPAKPAVKWKQNALRHSYASHRFAQTANAGGVAGELGNSAAVVHRHYRELVKPAGEAANVATLPREAVRLEDGHPLDDHIGNRYGGGVIASFACKKTERLWQRVRNHGLPPTIESVALRKLTQLHVSRSLTDLRVPPGNRLGALQGAQQGRHSIRINDQWRLCFRWQGEDAHEVEIVDYH